jgi:alpha-beta hydrolase superfamily lysophospholipase
MWNKGLFQPVLIGLSLQKKSVKKFWKWVKIALTVYIAAGIALYFLQEKLLFRPEKLSEDHVFNFPLPFKEINLAVNNEKNLSIIQFTVPDSVCKGVVLYFHGNRRNIERYAPFASNFTKNNYEVWMIDYPGFGKSTGDRNEQILYDDAIQFYKMARARFAKDSIIIYGRSLGTGIASYLASVKDCKRLILEAPYYSMDALFSHYAFIYPVEWMTKYHFPTYKYFEKIDASITIFHGTRDEIIPYSQSEMLMKPWNEMPLFKKELITIEKGKHNTLNDFPLFHQKLDSILQH